MKEPAENEVFDFFRAGLTGAENKFSDGNWDAMEQLLDEQPRKKRSVIWLYRLSAGIAAMLLLATAFYFLSPVTPDVNKIAKSVNSGNTNKVMKTEAVAFVRQGKVLKRALLAFTTKQRTKKSHGGLGLNKVIRIPAESIGYVNSPKNDIYALMLNPALLSPAKTFQSVPRMPRRFRSNTRRQRSSALNSRDAAPMTSGVPICVSSRASRTVSSPWAFSCRAISNATTPPAENPPMRYGPLG